MNQDNEFSGEAETKALSLSTFEGLQASSSVQSCSVARKKSTIK